MGNTRFMISEAAKKVQVESHVLRYWEDELDIKIGRTEMGHRYYTEDDIQLFCCIKKLKNEGMLLRDLKPLIPELQATKLKIQENSATTQELSAAESPADSSIISCTPEPADVITLTQLEQARSLIGDVLTEVVTENNEILKKDISKSVTSDVMREMDFLFQAKERREEEHFRKLDCLIRQQQANRRESIKSNPLMKLKKILT